jgi:hypothetical protein
MGKWSGRKGNGRDSPKKGGFPIVVPTGDKYPPTSRVPQWNRDYVSSSSPPPPSTPPAEKTQDGKTQDKFTVKPKKAAEPVQRATTQLLPGRLEPLEPIVLQQEVRFIRGSEAEQVVTLGWDLGEPPEHVTLNHSSVQPLHARMTYRSGNWWIENLAHYHPVEVNEFPLPVDTPPRILSDGDRIRIGEILFRFCFP